MKTIHKSDIELERHEAKYIIPHHLVEPIREYIRPFCVRDPNAEGELPEYTVTTLQLDSDDLALYRAKEVEAINRFKLRIRTYGEDGTLPVFLEIKRKIKGIIVKSRVTIPGHRWRGKSCLEPGRDFKPRSGAEEQNYLNFLRLVRETGSRPVTLIRYERESYLSREDNYARVTFDRRIRYQPMNDWVLLPKGRRWLSMDSQVALNRDYPGVILELKTFSDCPRWMVEMTRQFDLVRVGFCKYFTALRLESVFAGARYSEAAENCTYG